MLLAAAAWTGVCVVALLLSERSNSRAGVWCAKPAASLGFVALAWFGADLDRAFAGWMFAALLACALGDVLLIPLGRGPMFLGGLGSFALGHALFARAFWALQPVVWVSGAALIAMGVVAWFTLRWLDPHLDRPLYWAVRVYIAIIALMVATAAGATAATSDARIALGAVAFAASDLSVARERFVRPGFVNLLWGLPLYYAAQLLLAWSAC